MTVVELRPHPVDINVWAGAPVTLEFTATLADEPVDLSGATIVAQILTATGVEATTFGQTVAGAGDNVLTLALTGVKTTALLTSLAGSPGRVSVTVDGFPWLGGSISIYPPGSAKAQPSFERTFAVTTGDGLSIAVEVIGGAGGGGAVDSVNGATGVVVLDADDIDDTSTTNKFATAAQLSAVDGLASTYQPLDADLTTLAAGNIPTNLNASLASQYAPLNGDDETYGPDWNGATDYPTKNAVYDKIETVGGGSTNAADIAIADTADLYDATDVEAALAEVATDVAAIGGGYSSVWVRAQVNDIMLAYGSPAFTTIGVGSNSTPYWPICRFDPATDEGVRGVVIPPAGWATFDIDLYWTAVTASPTGDVVWRWEQTSRTDADSLVADGYTAQPTVTDTIPDLRILKVTRLVSGATALPDEPMLFQLSRIATDAGDTCADDAAVVGIRLRRAS